MSEKDKENMDSQNHEEENQDGEDQNKDGEDQNDDGDDQKDNDYTEREKGLYARLKKEEAARKALEEKYADKSDDKKEDKKVEQPDISQTVREALEEEYLADQDLPKEIKDKARQIAKVDNIRIKDALKDPYITFQIEEYKRQESVANASAGGTSKGSSTGFDPDTPPQVDLSTKDGRDAFDEWERKRDELRKNK